MITEIKKRAHDLEETLITNRRHLHAHPELSFHEYETSAFVKKQLDDIGITWKPMANTGIIGIIKGEIASDRVIALRADMDALPITESNQVNYASLKG
jgi:metal-dependent amidase/aminoacylase/carboxypeptidase family protein